MTVGTYSFTGSIIQVTVGDPGKLAAGIYDVTTYGAQGGNGGGLGAKAGGRLTLTTGELLEIVVGGAGANGTDSLEGGGGGGSFVLHRPNNTVGWAQGVMAGGGGGGGTGGYGQSTRNAGGAFSIYGKFGAGGYAFKGGGGGGGFGGNGNNGRVTGGHGGGNASTGNFTGGTAGASGGAGGFGGGGGGGYSFLYGSGAKGGGGGGGYSGGKGGYNSGGFGGGSYASGTNQVLLAAQRTGNGLITFTVPPPLPPGAPTIDPIGGVNSIIGSGGETADQTITGTTAAGTTVTLNFGGARTAIAATVSGTTWSYTLLPADIAALGQGSSKTIAATASGSGGASAPATSATFGVDTIAPAAPVVSSAALTNVAAPTLTGTAEANSTVTVTVGGATYSVTATGGAWSIDLGAVVPTAGSLTLNENGNNVVSVTATDPAGNVSTPATQTLTIDTTPPAAPAITSPALTNDATPVISGTAEAGSTVTLSVGGTTYTAVATGGAWSIDLGTAVPTGGALVLDPNGDNPISVAATDPAGNPSDPATQTLAIDTTAPSGPAIDSVTDDVGPVTGSLTPGASTDDTDLTVVVRLTGTGAAAGDTVQLYDGTGTGSPLGAAHTLTSGEIDDAVANVQTGTLTNGITYTITARVTDQAGNRSGASGNFAVTEDTTILVPAITSAALTNVAAPTLTGTAEANSTVTVTVGGATYSVTATGGAWSIDLGAVVPTAGSLTLNENGNNVVSVTATDPAGNVSTPATQTLTIDTTPPAAPAITSPALTNDATPVISGTAEAGSTVTLSVGGATYIIVATGGAWSVDLGSAEPASGALLLDPNGDNPVSVAATDPAGNPSDPATQTLAIDTTAPTTPAIESVTDDVGSVTGSLAPGASTDDTDLTVVVSLTGTGAVAGDAVRLYDGTGTLGPLGAAHTLTSGEISDGVATVQTGTLTDGITYAITARVTDQAGNQSGASGSFAVTEDTLAPTLTITSGLAQLKIGQTAVITFSFSEDPGGSFTWNGTTGDVLVTGGTLGAIAGSGLTRTATFTPTAGTAAGVASITVASGAYTDAAGNTGGAGTTPAVSIDTLAPTLTITSNVAQLKVGETATITFTFSEDPGGSFTWNGTTGDVVVTGGTLGTISGSGLTRTAIFTPTAGTAAASASITVASGAYTDTAGNTGGAGTTPAVSIDTLAPTLAITSNVAQLKVGETAVITFSFSEDPGGSFTWNGTTGDVVVTGGTLGAISGSGLTRTATFTPTAGTAAGSASITVASSAYTDAAGNTGGAGTTPAVSIDTLAPTLTITSNVAQLKVGETATITFTFSEDPGGSFTWNGTTGDVVVTGGTLGTISGSGLTRTAIFTPTAGSAAGSASITVASGVYTDAAGNTGGAGTTPAVSIDTLAPTLTITSNAEQLKVGETATVTFSFSEDPGGSFTWNGTTGDVVVTGGTLGAISGSGLTRTATFTPTAGTAAGTASITVASGAYTDTAGNTGGAGTTPAVSIDTLAPTLTITSGLAQLKIGQTAVITFSFSEDPGGSFTWNGTAGDVLVTGGTLGAIAGSGLTRTATFTPTAGTAAGVASITVASGAYTDTAGNTGGAGTTPAISIDTLAPTLAITSNVAQLKVGETATITFTFSEDPGGSFTWNGTTGDVVVTGGTLGTISGSGLTRTAIFTPTAGSAAGSASITVASGAYTDAAGNTGGAGTTPAVSIDTLAPTLTITSNVAQLKVGETATITFSFSEDPGGSFTWNGTTGDVVVTGGTLGTISGSGLTRTATFTPTAGTAAASASITVASSLYTDTAGNTGGAGTAPAISIDTLAPTLAITSNVAQLKVGETATVTFSFSEDPGGSFAWNGTTGDVVVTGGTLGAISGSGLTRTATFTPTAGTAAGTASITVASGAYTDAAGNSGGAGTTPAVSIDTTRPTATVLVADTALAAGETTLVTIVFSEAVSGFDNNDLTVENGTLSAVGSSDGGVTWAATLTPAAGITDTTNQITLNNAGVADAAGNTGTGTTTSNNYATDTMPPDAPVITSPALSDLAAPVIAGTAETGSTVVVTIAGATFTTIATGGVWSINLASAVPASGTLALNTNGTNNVSVTATDLAGNISTGAATQTLTLTPPSITGTIANQGVPNQTPGHPFATVSIVGVESEGVGVFSLPLPAPGIGSISSSSFSVTVTLSAPADGTLSNLSGGTYNASTGVFSVTGTTAALTAALRALVFTPIVQPNTSVVTTGFTIALANGGAVDTLTSVTAVQQILGLADVPINQIVISVSPDGSTFAMAQPGMTNEAVVTNPVTGHSYAVPAGYQALFLEGTADATLSDATQGNAYLVANSGSDTLIANAPNDILVAGSGDDSLFGGAFASTVAGGSGSATVFAGTGLMQVIQGSGTMVFGGNNNAGSSIFGGTGANGGTLSTNLTGANQTVSVGSSAATVTVSGSGGNVIGGTSSLNVTVTGSGNTVQAGSGSNTVFSGGSGNSIVGSSVAGSGSSQIFETGSNNTIQGGVNSMTVTTTGATQVTGGSGSLTFVGGSGTSSVFGGAGATTVSAGTGGVVLQLGSSVTATANSGTGAVTVFGAAGATINLTGSSGKDYLIAGSGSETLNASASSSSNWLSVSTTVTASSAMLVAGSGNDTLIAGSALGSSTMTGGGGSDAFVFFKQAVGGAHDVITDFGAGDSVYIEGYAAGSAGALVSAAAVGSGGLTLTLSDSTTITFSNLTNGASLTGRIQYG